MPQGLPSSTAASSANRAASAAEATLAVTFPPPSCIPLDFEADGVMREVDAVKEAADEFGREVGAEMSVEVAPRGGVKGSEVMLLCISAVAS